METQQRGRGAVLVACPDARPPAYQAAVGLDRAGRLHSFCDVVAITTPAGRWPRFGPRLAPLGSPVAKGPAQAARPRDPRPPRLGLPGVDLVQRLEARVAGRSQTIKGRSHRGPAGSTGGWPGRGASPARGGPRLQRRRLGVRLPLCRRLGIPTILSMVHGDVREERAGPRARGRGGARLLPRSTSATAPSTATSWTGSTSAGSATSSWPTASSSPPTTSPRRSTRHGTPRARSASSLTRPIRRRFRPDPDKRHERLVYVPLRGRDHPAQGDQVPARSLAAGPSAGLAAPAARRLAARPGPLGRLPRRGRAPGPRLARRDAGADGRGRRVRLPVAVRGLGRRHLRGAGLRPAERRHARTPGRSSATGSKGSSCRPATSRHSPRGWSDWASDPSSARRWSAAARRGPRSSTGRGITRAVDRSRFAQTVRERRV